MSEVAGERGCDWSAVTASFKSFGEMLRKVDIDRCVGGEALGLDESLYVKRGARHLKAWETSLVDVVGLGRDLNMIEVIEGGTAKTMSEWIDALKPPGPGVTRPPYRCRRLLIKVHEQLDDKGETKPIGPHDAGDPQGEVRMAWHTAHVTNRPVEGISSLVKKV